jgi:undecaprenyl-diphosphatase
MADRPASTQPSDTPRHLWLILAVLGYLGFAGLSVLVAARVVIPLDQTLFDTIHGWTSLTPLWQFVSDSANYPLIVVGVAIVAWLLYHRQFREAFVVIVVLAAATAGSEAVKQLVHRPRPPGADARVLGVVYSYPSGHTLEAMTIYGIIAFHVWRGRWSHAARLSVVLLLAAVVVLVCVARIAIGAHYPSDVLAGLLVGLGDLGVYAWATQRSASAHDEERRADDASTARAA